MLRLCRKYIHGPKYRCCPLRAVIKPLTRTSAHSACSGETWLQEKRYCMYIYGSTGIDNVWALKPVVIKGKNSERRWAVAISFLQFWLFEIPFCQYPLQGPPCTHFAVVVFTVSHMQWTMTSCYPPIWWLTWTWESNFTRWTKVVSSLCVESWLGTFSTIQNG